MDISLGNHKLFEKAEYGLIPSLSTVLIHEVERYNNLLDVINRTLTDMVKAVKGEILLTDDLDKAYKSLL